MKKSPMQIGLQTGIIFGIILSVIFLIGFTVTGAQLVAKILGDAKNTSTSAISYYVIFMALVGLWCGSIAAKKPDYGLDKISDALLSGAIAGFLNGLILAVIGVIFGMFADSKIDIRTYLVAVSSDVTRQFLFNQPTMVGAALLLGLMLITGIAGAALAVTLRTSSQIKMLSSKTSEGVRNTIKSQEITKFLNNKYTRSIFLIICAIILIILPRTWGGYWNYVFGTIGIYVILGLGLNIITGWAGQLVIGYVAFFAVGAYTFALLTAPEPHHLMWNFWIALILGIIAAAISGILIGLPILNLRGDYLAIVTLGFSEIVRILLKSDLLTSFTGGPRGVHEVGGPTLFGTAFNNDVDFMYLIIVAVLVVSFLAYRLQNSRTGKAWMAINLDETVARATGVNAFMSKLLALALSAAVAGLAGALFASRNQFTGPDDHQLMVAINVLCLIIVGGIGNIPGVFLGAFVLKGVPEILREIENYRMLAFGVLLIVMMRLRPEGFLPAKRPTLENIGQLTSKTGKDA